MGAKAEGGAGKGCVPGRTVMLGSGIGYRSDWREMAADEIADLKAEIARLQSELDAARAALAKISAGQTGVGFEARYAVALRDIARTALEPQREDAPEMCDHVEMRNAIVDGRCRICDAEWPNDEP